jgi:hypothetical protein
MRERRSSELWVWEEGGDERRGFRKQSEVIDAHCVEIGKAVNIRFEMSTFCNILRGH